MAFKKKSKKVEDTHNFGVPSADDEMGAKPVEPKAEKKVLPSGEIKNHSKFDKFKKGNS